MSKDIINICVSVNSRYVRYLYVMLVSLLENNKEDLIRVFVMNRDLTSDDKNTLGELFQEENKEIDFVFVDERKLDIFPTTKKFSLETYFRFLIPELLPETVHKALYLDVDIIVNGSLKALFATDLDGHIFGCCRDMALWVLDEGRQTRFGRKDDLRYYNCGVMLLDIDRLRDVDLLNKCVEAGRRLGFDLQFADQEILNYLFYKDVKYLDPFLYNYVGNKRFINQSLKGELERKRVEDAIIVHYSGYNPWNLGPKDESYRLWWSYAKKTPYYLELLEEQLYKVESYLSTEIEEERQKRLQDQDIRFIMEYALELNLMGIGLVETYVEKNGKHILYGLGQMAEVLKKIIGPVGFDKDYWEAVDRNRKGSFCGLEIHNDFSFIDDRESYTVIATPTYGKRRLLEDLQNELPDRIQVMSLRRFLRIVVEENKKE